MYFGDIFIYGLFGLVICAIVLFVWWKIAEEFYDIAVGKGYKDRKYFWYCFLFSVVGYLLVIALPDKKAKASAENETAQVVDELPEI